MKEVKQILFGLLAMVALVVVITAVDTPKAYAADPGIFIIRPLLPIYIRPIELELDTDTDDDGIDDGDDNCPEIANPDQINTDDDDTGDACDDDLDGDGYLNDEDNCLAIPNGDCVDTAGDIVDEEMVLCTYDLEDEPVGPNQEDVDEDGVGDACDDDVVPVPAISFPTFDADGGGCSLTIAGSGSAAGIIWILLGLVPLAIRRKR